MNLDLEQLFTDRSRIRIEVIGVAALST